MKVVAFTYILDEEATIEACINNSIEQGMVPFVINNGCIDRSMDIVRGMGVECISHFTDEFDMYDLVRFGSEQARKLGCDWCVLKDADELMETYDGRTVAAVIEEADRAGYNCINFDSYSFWPTVDDDVAETDFTKRINHYTFFDIPWQRAVKNIPGVWLHHPHYAGGDVCVAPVHPIIRHYKFVDAKQGKAKVKLRRLRYKAAEVAQGSHTHYNRFTDEDRYYVLERDVYQGLNRFDGTWIRKQVWDEWR
jgi:hypothetical protein